MVALTMRGCGHCTALKPVIRALEAASDVDMVEVDSRSMDAWAREHGVRGMPKVRGFPTILAVRDGAVVDVFPSSADRSEANLRHWISKL